MKGQYGVAAPIRPYTHLARLGYATIAVAFGLGGIWAATARLDGAAIAPGQVVVESKRKPIQHFEGGILKDVYVKEAQRVRRGDLLFRIEPVRFQAELRILQSQLNGRLARQSRLEAERDGLTHIVWPDALNSGPARFHGLKTREARLFEERRKVLSSQKRILQSRISNAQREIAERKSVHAAYLLQIDSIAGDLKRLTTLKEKSLYPATKFAALERAKMNLAGEAARTEADIARARSQIDESRLRMAQVAQEFRQDVLAQLSKVEAAISDLREKIKVATDTVARSKIQAPYDGIVQSISVSARGSVIAPGQTLAEIVPVSDKLIVSAHISPEDIDAVHKGQHAEIRFTGLSTRKMPIVHGTVTTLSADVITGEAHEQGHYLAQLTVDYATIDRNVVAKLVPGMPVQVLLSTGERTALDYLASPLTDLIATSMREE